MRQYKGTYGQTMLDVCLNTYGTLNYFVKLCRDNNVDPEHKVSTGDSFIWDETLAVDQSINRLTNERGVVYQTAPKDYFDEPLPPILITALTQTCDPDNAGGSLLTVVFVTVNEPEGLLHLQAYIDGSWQDIVEPFQHDGSDDTWQRNNITTTISGGLPAGDTEFKIYNDGSGHYSPVFTIETVSCLPQTQITLTSWDGTALVGSLSNAYKGALLYVDGEQVSPAWEFNFEGSYSENPCDFTSAGRLDPSLIPTAPGHTIQVKTFFADGSTVVESNVITT